MKHLLFILLGYLQLPALSMGQNWEQVGFVPGYAIAYDQNGNSRTVITSRNIYRSTDGGNTWQQQLSRDNAFFLNNTWLEFPYWTASGDRFRGFTAGQTYAFDDILFLTAKLGVNSSSSDIWALYNSKDGGATLTEAFFESEPYQVNATYGYDYDIYEAENGRYIIRFKSNGIIANGGDKASIYVSTDEGASWTMLFSYPENEISYVGNTATSYVFLHGTELIYYNSSTLALEQTITVPDFMRAGRVVDNRIELLSWDYNGLELRGYTTDNGPSGPFTAYSNTFEKPIREGQIFEAFIAISAGQFSHSTQTYKLNFASFNTSTAIGEFGAYKDLYPYRKTTDGVFVNLEAGAKPHYPNFFAIDGGAYFNSPFRVSTDELNTFSDLIYPDYALQALPELNGQHVLFAGSSLWRTTDGQQFTKSFDLTSHPSRILYFETAVYGDSYSDPSTTYFLTNNGTSVASNESDILGVGATLYSYRENHIPAGIYQSTDNGNTWTFLNNGTFWGRMTIGDDVTGIWYGFENPTNSSRVSISMDQGQSWELLEGANIPIVNQEDFYFYDYLPISVYNGYFIVKSNTDLLYSIDGGASFQTVSNLPFELGHASVYRLGAYINVLTAAEEFYRVNINEWLGTQPAPQLPGSQVDLELSVAMNPPNPGVWQNFDVIYTITNNGSTTATSLGLNYFISSFVDGSMQGGTTPDFVNLSGVGGNTLAAGESGSITFHYFRRDGNPIEPWGQLVYSEPDVDSNSDNADYPANNEDDEVFLSSDPNAPCLNDITPPNLSPCPPDINVAITGVDTFLIWDVPTYSDNCPGNLDFNVFPGGNGYSNGRSYIPVGTNLTLTYSVQDISYNYSSCSFNIQVTDGNVPVCQSASPSNPADLDMTTTLEGRTDFSGTYQIDFYQMPNSVLCHSTSSTLDNLGQVTLSNMEADEYMVVVKHPQYLTEAQMQTLTTGSNQITVGPLRAGDANDDNLVTILDFSILASTFNLQNGDSGYDERADFTGDNLVTILDFSWLAANYNQAGDDPMNLEVLEDRNRMPYVPVGQADLILSQVDNRQEESWVSIQLISGKQPVDAAQVSLNFDPKELEILEVEIGKDFPMMLSKMIENNSGKLELAVGALDAFPSGIIELGRVRIKKNQETITLDIDPSKTEVTFYGQSILGGWKGLNLEKEHGVDMHIFPNPVIEEANIQLNLGSQHLQQLTILDIDGRLVETLFQGNNKTQGVNSWNWNTANYGAGIYFVRLITSEGEQVRKKVVVLK